MKQKLFFTHLVIGLFSIALSAHAQYAPSAPGSLGVGKVTETSIEWMFNLNGALVSDVQLFVGEEITPRVTVQVPNYAVSIVENGLRANMRYEKRRIRALYYGTPGAFSDYFPPAVTLAKIPSVTFEPIVGSSANLLLNAGDGLHFGEGKTGWQVYIETQKELHDWASTQLLQLGPFEQGKTYVFKFRTRNADGVATDWSNTVSYTVPVSSTLIFPPAPPETPSVLGTITVKSGVAAINVRTLPTLSGKRIGVIRSGTPFEILESQSDWYKIQFTAAVQGWVSGKYVFMTSN